MSNKWIKNGLCHMTRYLHSEHIDKKFVFMKIFQQQEPDFETYIHRIGRTGRFGKSGIAINFVSSTRDQSIINRIASHFKTSILALDAGDYDDLENKLKK